MDDKFLTQRIVKAFRHIPPLELPEAPVHAIKGLSEHDSELLYDSFWVKTIRDLADLKYVHWAQEICALRDVPQEKIDMYGFQDKLNKAYEQTSFKTLMKSPVHVLQGLSEADATRLEEAFRIRTVKDLANLKFARFAQEICREAYKDLSAPIRSNDSSKQVRAEQKDTKRWWAPLIALILTVIALLLLAYFAPICYPAKDEAILDTASEQQSSPPSDSQASDEGDSDIHQNSTDNKDSEGSPSPQADTGSPSTVAPDQDESDTANQSNTRATHEANGGSPGTYHVQAGDTLYDISKRIYGNPGRWQDIYQANKERLKSPDRLVPGEVLKLP